VFIETIGEETQNEYKIGDRFFLLFHIGNLEFDRYESSQNF